MIRKYNPNDRISMDDFKEHVFIHVLECLENGERCNLDYFYDIVDIVCYLLFDVSVVETLCPIIPFGEMQQYLKAVHMLFWHGYQSVVENMFKECRLPVDLCRNIPESYHRFAKKYRSARKWTEWYVTKCQPRCVCYKCTTFRSERFVQMFDGGEYATPFFGEFQKSPLSNI